jgi:hypothetical protein
MSRATITSRQQADALLGQLEQEYNPGFYAYRQHRIQMGESVRALSGQQRSRALTKEEQEELSVLSPRQFQHLMGGARAALGVLAQDHGTKLDYQEPIHRQELIPRYPKSIPGTGIRAGDPLPFAGPEIPESHVLREKGAAAVPVNYMAATWMGRSPTSVWWNLMEEPPKEASEKAQEKYRKAQQDFGKRERAAGMHEQWGLRTPDPTGGLVSRQSTGRYRAGPLARTPEQYTQLQTAYTMTGEHYMSGIATIDLPKTSEWYQEQTKEVWLGTGKERTQEVFPKGRGHTWEAGEKRQWIEGGVEETSQFGGMVTGVRPTWRTVPDPLTGKQQTEQGYRFTYERIAPAQGQMMPKIGDQPGKQVLQQGDLSSFVHAETGKPLGVEMVMFGKLASGLSSSVFQALPKRDQKEVMKRAIREQPDLAGRKRSSIAYGEIAPTMMKYVQEELPDWVVPATEKNVEMHRDVLESGVYKGMITGGIRKSPLGERFGIADLSYPVMIPPHGTAQQIYMEYGVNEPRMNMEMLRQIERVDPGLHKQIVSAGEERRSSYRRVGRAALASQDPAFMRENTIDMTQELGRSLIAPAGGTTLFGEAEAARASLEEQGLSGKEAAAAFMRGGAPEAMQQNPMLFQAKGESVVMPALKDFSVLAASGLFPDESVSKLEMMGYNVIGGALRGEAGHGQAQSIARYREAQREWTSSNQFGRETQSIYLPSGPGKSGDIFGFGAVASYHRKLGDDEAYSPFVEGGRVGNVWGQPVQHGGKHFTPEMEVNWLSKTEMERRGLPTDVAAVGMQMWQAAARDWDADLMYGLMKGKARWDEDKQMWMKPDGSAFDTNEAAKLGRESLKAGAGDVMEDIIQGYKDPVTGERRPHTPAEAIEEYTKERMSGFRNVSLEETRASIHERAKIQSHIGPYYMTYRQGLAMSRSERETQAVEAFHQRSHGFAQRPAKLPEWAQRIHTAMTWTERSGVYERYKDKTAAAPYKGVSGLMREMQSALISSYLLPKGERKEQGVMKSRDIASLLAPKGRRGEFRQALKAGRKVGPSAEAGLLETLRGMPNLERESPMGRWGVGRLIYSMRQEPIRDEKTDAFQGYRTRTLPEFTEALRDVGMLPHEDLQLSDEKRQELEQAGMMKASELYMMGALQKAYRRSQAKDLPAVHDPNAPERGSAQEVAHALTWAAETGFGGGLVEVAAAAKEFGYALPGNVRSWTPLTEPKFPGLAAEGADAEIRLTEPAALAEAASERGFFGTERDVARSQAIRGNVERAYEKSMSVVYPSALNWGSKEHMLTQEVSATFSQMERMGLLKEGEKEQLMPPAGSGGQGQKIHELTQKQAAAGKMPGRGPKGSKGWFVKVDGEWEEQPIRGAFPGETGEIRGRLDLPWGMEFGGKKWGALDIKPMDIDVNASRAEIQAAMDEQMTQRKGVGAYRAQLSTYHWLGRERGWDADPTGVVPYPKALRDKPKKAAKWIREQLERGGPFDVSKHMMSRESTIETIQAYEKLQTQMGPRIMEVAGNIAMGTTGFEVPSGLGWGGQIKHFGQYLEAGDVEKISVAAEEMGVMPADIVSGLAQMAGEGAQAAAGGAGTGGTGGDDGKFLRMFANFFGGQGAGAGGGSVNMSADFGTMERVANIQRQLGYVTGAGADLARVSKEIQAGGQRPSEGQRRLVSKIRNPLIEAGELVKGLEWVNAAGGTEALQEAGRNPQDIKKIQQAVFDLTKTRREVWDSQRGLFQNIEQQEIEATVRQAAAEARPFATQGLLQLTMGKLSEQDIKGLEKIRPQEVSALMGEEVPSFAQMEEMGFKNKTQRAIAKLTRQQGPEFALQEAERIGDVLGKDWTGSKQDFAKLATNVKSANEALEAIGGLDKQTIKEKGKAFAERLDQAEAQLKRAVKGEPVIGAAEYMRDRGAAQLADLETLSKKRGLKPAEQQRLQGLASMAVMGAAPGAEEIPEAEQVRGITDRQRMREAEAAISGKRMPGQPDRRGFQDMGLAGAAAGTVHRFMSGWELMRLRRMWGMTGQPIFDQYIPAAAQHQMANWQMATQAAGYGGPPTGAAGGMMELQAGKQRALIQAGEIGYDAWGWAAPMMQGFQRGQAAWGPAVGAGLVGGALASTAGMTTGMGAAAAATKIGLPVSAAIAGALGMYAAGQYAMAGVEPTVPNMAALYEAQQAGIGGPSRRFDIGARMDWQGLQETRAFLGLPETERPGVPVSGLQVKDMFTPEFNIVKSEMLTSELKSTTQEHLDALGIGDTGFAEFMTGTEKLLAGVIRPSQKRAEQEAIKETERAMIQKYEELRGTPMTDMEARFRTGMIGDTIQNLAEMAGTAYPMLAPEQIQGAVGELMPYMEDTTPEGIEKYMKSEFAQQVAVTGVGPEAMRPVAEQLRMGRDFRMKMAQRISPMGAAQQEELMTAMGQWAPLQRFGYTAEEIFQSVMPDETGGRPLYGRADMEKALLGETGTRKKLTGQQALAQEEALAATGIYAQATGQPLTSPEVQEFWKEMEAKIYVEDGRFQIQNAAIVIQPAAQAFQMTGRPVDEIMAEYGQALAAGQTVQGLYMMNQIEQGQGPLQAAAGIPAGFMTGLGQRAYGMMGQGVTPAQMTAMGGAIGFGRTQMGYSMMAGGWGAGDALSGLYGALGMEGPAEGAKGFYDEDFRPIGQAETIAIQRGMQDRQREYQQYQADMSMKRLTDPQYGAFAQLETSYGYQMGGYEVGGTATGLLGQQGMHQEMMEFVGIMRDVNNRMKILGRDQQWAGLAAQESQALLGYRQGREKLGLARRRFAEDVRHQEAMMGLQAEQMGTTQQWQREDIAWGRETAGLQYEYQMDELGRGIRLAGGREKQQLLRKREYMEEMYGREEAKRNVDAERAEQRMEWERTRFQLERRHFEARTQFQQEEFDMQRRHMDENLNMQLGNIGRQKLNLEAMWALQDERQAVQEEWEDRQHEVQGERIDEQIAIAEVNYEQAHQELEWRKEELIEAQKYFDFIKGEEDDLRLLEDKARERQREFTEWLMKQWEEGGALYNAILALIDVIKGTTDNSGLGPITGDQESDDWHPPKPLPVEPKPAEGDSIMLVVDQQVAFKAHIESLFTGKRVQEQEAGGWGGLWQ